MTRKARNKFLSICLIAVFLFSNFSNAAIVFADSGQSGLDKAQALDVEFDSEHMKGFFNKEAILFEKNGKKYIQMQGNSGKMIEEVKVDGQPVEREGGDDYTLQFEMTKALDSKLDLMVHVNVPGVHEAKYNVKVWFNQKLDEQPEEDSSKEDEETEGSDKTEDQETSQPESGKEESDKTEEPETPQPGDKEDSDKTEKPADKEEAEEEKQPEGNDGQPTEKPSEDKNETENENQEQEKPSKPETEEKPEETEKPADKEEPKEDKKFVQAEVKHSFSYASEMNLSRYYEDKIDIAEKDGKQYLQLNGTGMANFIGALYVDGEEMTLKANKDGSYIAQIEHDKDLKKPFNFKMVINTPGRVMEHSTDVTLLIPDLAQTITYTTEGANIAGSYEAEAILIEKDGKTYIQLQGKSMRQFIEYLYIDGKKMDLSNAINPGGAYLAQFELSKPLAEKNTFSFDMVINARGTLMSHKTEITFDESTLKDANALDNTLVKDTSTKNSNKIVKAEKPEDEFQMAYVTEGADISRNYENFATIVTKDDKQYLQLHGKSQHQFVDALFIDGKRMNIGDGNEDGSYLAQYELPEQVEAGSTYDFTMLINARGRIMMHSTKIIMTPTGEFLIDFDALYQDEDKTSTASNYLVNPTKLEIGEKTNKLFIKLKDNKAITDFKVKQDGSYVSPKVVSTNEKANTRIVAFEIDKLENIIDAQVTVQIPGGKEEKQPFRIKLAPNSLATYDGSLEKDEEKPEKPKNGKYKINFRILDETAFEKVAIGSYLNPPANIELKGDKRTVTLTIDADKVEKFEIKQGDTFITPKIVAEDKEKKTYDVQFEISDLDEIVFAKMTVASQGSGKARLATAMPMLLAETKTEEHIVRLFFEGNSLEPVELDEEEAEELVAEKATEMSYKILQDKKDETSSANDYFSGKAVVLDYQGEQYVQISTKNKSASMIEYLKNQLNGQLVDMVVVENKDGDKTYQFKLENAVDKDVNINMYINVPGIYEDEHDARLRFDSSTAKKVEPKNYLLMSSTNANGPDGEDAQTPGNEEEDTSNGGSQKPTPTPTPTPTPNPKPNPNPAPTPKPSQEKFATHTVDFKILNEDKDKTSIADQYFTGKATVMEYKQNTYVQISTKGQSGDYIQSLQNQSGKNFKEMLVVTNKNGDKTFQFKLDTPLKQLVPLKMTINVPGIYQADHDAYLKFDMSTYKKSAKTATLYQDKTGAQGPKSFGEKAPKQASKSTGTKTSKTSQTKITSKDGKITPDKAKSIQYVIKQANSNETSIANQYFTGKAFLLERGNDTYVQITAKGDSAHFIDSLKSKLAGKYVEMAVAEVKSSGEKVYQFKLPGKLTDDVLLKMIITVPGVYENQEHDARLVFDVSTLKDEALAGKYIVASTNANGPSGKNTINPDKPAFGAGSDNALANGDAKTDKVVNPKTSDKTQIFIYLTLLLGAGTILFMQFRRRKVTES